MSGALAAGGIAAGGRDGSASTPVPAFGGLFTTHAGVGALARNASAARYVADLQLDRLIDVVVADGDQHDLRSAFLGRLHDVEAIERRQDLFADVRDERLLAALRGFCDGLAHSREQLTLASRTSHRRRSQALRLRAIASYVHAIESVTAAVADANPSSPALREWWVWLRHHRSDPAFVAMASGVTAAMDELDRLRYTLSVTGDQIIVSELAGEEDLAAATKAAFERFFDADVERHRFDLRVGAEMHQLQLALLDRVATVFPDAFARVDLFLGESWTFPHPVIDVVERELRFTLAWLDFVGPLQLAGLAFCLPDMRQERALDVSGTFDALLAHRQLAGKGELVTNDVRLGDDELLLVVTGPNQGGKTTFARTVGQLYHLACIGVPVPGRSASLHAPDAILTHFERGDRADDPESRLEEEVARVVQLLSEVSSRSVVVLNEMFSSTTFVDARSMSRDVLRDVLVAGAVGVWVTFIDELAACDPRAVSLVTGVDAGDTARRTFVVTRGPADGHAHALALAAEHGLTREQLRDRIGRQT